MKTSLIENLAYQPQELKFGTSGRRGLVIHLTQLEIYINALAELRYLQSLPAHEGGIARGQEFYFAYDLRPSSCAYVADQGGRGEIAQAIVRAIRDSGLQPVNLGRIPTPALTHCALERGRGSIMVTGSHIPFDRNGYKTNTAKGELLKKDEAPIQQFVSEIRQSLYREPCEGSPFDAQGLFKSGPAELPPEAGIGREDYLRRYCEFYPGRPLSGRRLLVYQHTAVGRDLLVDILEKLGAEPVPAGRSDTFVPIDTENIDQDQLAVIQALAAEHWHVHGPLDAVVSTDGDSDRPLILGVEPADPCRVRFYGGDLVGMVVAEHLGAGAVVVPISCNDAIDRGPLRSLLEPKTRIGSPYVIAGMQKALAKGRTAVCGWEANGGFLTGSDLHRGDNVLKALPTRDAVLPVTSVLVESCARNLTIPELFGLLPKRFSRATLLKNFPRTLGDQVVSRFSPPDALITEAVFEAGDVMAFDGDGISVVVPEPVLRALESIRNDAASFFTKELGFADIVRINYVDGVRFYFRNGDVAHIRPSGNADELRIYAVADTQSRADAIAAAGVAEPGGILRRLAKG